MKNNIKNKNYGTVIILKGQSVAGKSSIQKAFQNLAVPNLWLKVGIDNLFDQPMPDITPSNMDFWQSKNPIRWVSAAKDNEKSSFLSFFAKAKWIFSLISWSLLKNTSLIELKKYERACCDLPFIHDSAIFF